MLLLLALAGAHAAGFVWPPVQGGEQVPLGLRLAGGAAWGLVPEFRAAERDRTSGELALRWAPEGPFVLDVRGSYLAERWVSGRQEAGWGDLRLGTELRLWDGPLRVHSAWQAKLPNASDEVELGTDETDVTVLVAVSGAVGPVTLSATGGLAIIGNPLMFANQDDVPVAWAAGSVPVGPIVLLGRVGGGFSTSRNPARFEGILGVEGQCPWLVGVEGGGGFTAAAADWAGRAWVGWGGGCGR